MAEGREGGDGFGITNKKFESSKRFPRESAIFKAQEMLEPRSLSDASVILRVPAALSLGPELFPWDLDLVQGHISVPRLSAFVDLAELGGRVRFRQVFVTSRAAYRCH